MKWQVITESEKQIEPIANDIYTWPEVLPNSFREQIVKSGMPPIPKQRINYPQHNGRSFNEKIFHATHPNGTSYKREWLMYSEASDSVYCLFCALFKRNANLFCAVGRGYSDWKNMKRDVASHEITFKHHSAFKSWLEFSKRLETNQTIDAEQKKLLNREIDRWKEVMKRLVACVQFLAQQSLAFRGHTSKLYDRSNGNFLKLMEMLAKFDPVMTEHLNRATTTSKRHYLSNRIQNELIDSLATCVKEFISNAVVESKYYAVIVDCTSDLSHVEQMSIILRYVALCPNENKYKIEERFLSFSPCMDSTGEGIANAIAAELEKVNLDLQDIRGQGYDNGPNMAGVIKGVQSRVLELNSRALFVPCACHKLNLMLNDTAKLVDDGAFKFFETVQKCFVFFSDSPKRWAILQKFAEAENITLKNVSTTRWSSREAATKCLLLNLPKVHAALREIANDQKRDAGSYDANKLAKKISKFKFICGVVVWHNILSKINIVSKSLQAQSIDITHCLKLIEKLRDHFKEVRESGAVIDEWFEKAKQIRSEFCLEPTALDNMATQRRPVRSQLESLNEEEDDQHHFKISFVYPILDVALSKLQERFKHLTELENLFGFLFDLHSLEISLEQCQRLEKALTSKKDGGKDLHATQLFDEIKSFQALVDDDGEKSPMEFLNKIHEFGLVSIYPNLTTALRVFLTLPVTAASAESSFSKLKLIKNYLRTTMGEDRLTNLAMISIESELLDCIPQESVIQKFAAAKLRHGKFASIEIFC